MANFIGLLLSLMMIHHIGLVSGKTPKEMNKEERKQFAMDMLSDVFETSVSPLGITSSQFGELRLDDLSDNLKAYQRLHSIPVTGDVDDRTMEEMMLPRCGLRDMKNMAQDMKRRKRYTVASARWDTNSPLSYWFKYYSKKLSHEDQRRIFAEAFKIWSDAADISFIEGSDTNKDIEILFARGEHGDGPQARFDGPGHVLAHAYFPSSAKIGGDAHFDEDETWTDNTTAGINLLQVVTHEIGHSLGLGHSSVRSAIMFPSYTGYQKNLALDYDDVLGIQKLYGPKKSKTTTTATTTTTTTTTQRPTTIRHQTSTRKPATTRRPTTSSDTDRNQFCADGTFDAITSFLGVTYVFKDDKYAVLDSVGMVSGYPRHISEKFNGLEGVSKIDAALSWDKHKIPRLYLFSGDKYWRYDNYGLRPGYPKLIKIGFPGLPSDIDVAFVWGKNGRTYVFKGYQYFRLSGAGSQTRGTVVSGYPRDSSIWNINSVFSQLNAAFTWHANDRTYMFSGDQYIRFDDKNIGVDSSSVPYPRKTKDWWLKCEAKKGGNFIMSEMKEAGDESNSIVIIPQADDKDMFVDSGSTFTSNILVTVITFLLSYLF
ncbi:hypothetical protein LSH36_16g14041 [Paralvinella palmiformis]|uniref:Peptidase metallopeptidase domain-containing protein n=1 Tax=Paralvinella palmiformis TaxID=53620 RepID=A0AAD9NFX0_9ANNE|nr:hypothetical protein LSH36_16g14041 [Paralvinella palmiformis]